MRKIRIGIGMKPILIATAFAVLFIFSAVNGSAQNRPAVVSAAEIIKRFEKSQPVNYENVTISGDLDLSNLPVRTNDAIYPENGKTARVYATTVDQPITFRNVIFDGKLNFFRRSETNKEINEYRIVFERGVVFENCTFNETANFELTNFNGGVSFAGSTFNYKPSFVRVGLVSVPDLAKTTFANGSIFKNFQNDTPQNLSAPELKSFYQKYIESRK